MVQFIQSIADRFRSPIFGNFIFSWLVTNWKIPYVTFFVNEDNLGITKLDRVILIIEGYGCNYYRYLFIYPFLYTLFMVTAFPWIMNGVEMIRLHCLFILDLYSETKQREFEKIEEQNQKLLLAEKNATNELKHNIFHGNISLERIFIGIWRIQIVKNNENKDYEDCTYKKDKFVSPERTILIFDNFYIDPENKQSSENFRAHVTISVVEEDTKDRYSIIIKSRDDIRFHADNSRELGVIIFTRQSVNLF